MIKNLLFTGLAALITVSLSAQCMDWVDPTPPETYLTIGDAPCSGESYTTGYQVYKSEAYLLANVFEGDNFTFDICNGPDAGTWVPEFTIIAPSGAVDNYGAGDGDGCSITWTATETGDYKIVINEAGNCGVGGDIDNGFPNITTNSGGIVCAEMLEGAESFESADGSLPDCWQTIDADGDGYDWSILSTEDDEDVIPFDGDYAIASFSYLESPGALNPDNWLITPQVTVGTDDSLYYTVRTLNHNYSEEEYAVYVSTTGTAVADFTDEVFSDNLEYVNQWQARSVDLGAYANQDIYIAFRHYGVSDLVGFTIDGVKLPGEVNCNPDGISELAEVESTVFPNPVIDNLHITSPLIGAATVRIFDALGRMVIERNVNLSKGTFTQNVSSLVSGIYTIQISNADQVSTVQFVKR